MTTSTSLSGRALSPKPPAKGSFPLDHLGECKLFAESYERCLREHGKIVGSCREAMRKYLQCRMDAGLMAKEEWSKLGLDSERDRPDATQMKQQRDERDGFVAGMRMAKRRKDRYANGGRKGSSPD